MITWRIKSLEIHISKDEQDNCHNCIEFSGIRYTINDDKLEETITETFEDIDIDVREMDVEVFHRLSSRRNAGKVGKSVRFVDHILRSTDFSRLNINNKLYVNTSLCPYYHYLW